MDGAQGHVWSGHGCRGAADDAGVRRRQHSTVHHVGDSFFHRCVTRLVRPHSMEAGAAQLLLEPNPMEGIPVRAEQVVYLFAQFDRQAEPAAVKCDGCFGGDQLSTLSKLAEPQKSKSTVLSLDARAISTPSRGGRLFLLSQRPSVGL